MANVEVEQVTPVEAENVEVPTKTVEEPVVESEVTQQLEEATDATEQEPEAPIVETSKEVVVEEEEEEKKDEEIEKKKDEEEEKTEVTESPAVVEEEKKEEEEEKEEVTQTPVAEDEDKKTEAVEVMVAADVAAEKAEE